MPRQEVEDLFAGRVLAACDEVARREQDARGAEAALERVAVRERLLQRAERALDRESLNGGQLRAVDLGREHQARAGGGSVHEDGAGSADPVLAADVRAGQPEGVAEEV